jgi:hypothetical protein
MNHVENELLIFSQSIPSQDGVYQLDGRIVQEDQYPIAGGGNANIYRGTLSRSDGRKIPVRRDIRRPHTDLAQPRWQLRCCDTSETIPSTKRLCRCVGVCSRK